MREIFEIMSRALGNRNVKYSFFLRIVSIPPAIIFIFFYSSLLGLERRGIVTAMLTITMFSSLVVEKGLSVASRIGKWEINTSSELLKTLRICIQWSLLVQVSLTLILFVATDFFSLTLFSLASILCLFQCTQYFINDFLFTKRKHLSAAWLETLSVFVQLILFTLLTFTSLTIASSIFVSGILTSTVNLILSARDLIKSKVLDDSSEELTNSLKNKKQHIFWSVTQYLHSNQEKALILFCLDFTNFAKFTICTAYFVVLKSVSDIGNKYLMQKEFNNLSERTRISVLLFIPLFIGTCLLAPSLYLTKHILGNLWLVSWTIIILSCVNECTRYLIYGESIRALQQSFSYSIFLKQLLWMTLTFILLLSFYHVWSPESFLPILFTMFGLNLFLLRHFKSLTSS